MTDPDETRTQTRTRAAAAVGDWLAAQDGLEVERLGEHSWLVMLAGERKRTIGVHIDVGDRHTTFQSFFMRAPDEDEAALYRYLLGRHLRTYVLRFARSADGDLLIVGLLPHNAVDTDELDRVLGQLLVAADEAFDTALRLGFSSYIEREQAWRVRTGQGRNPIT